MNRFLVALSFALSASAAINAQQHDRAYWQAIKANGFAVPAGASAVQLATELGALFGSPDPVLRDEVSYEILTAWILQKRSLSPNEIRPLVATWTGNLKQKIGENGNDGVLLRSFSALSLATVAARDNADPFLTPDEHAALLDAGLKYFEAERDLRGYDDRLGWIHATAHTADLIKFLARGKHLPPAGQRAILDAITKKLQSASVVFSFGEDERLARAIGSIIIRPDFDLASFREWVTASAPKDGPTSVASLRARQNVTNLLSKLAVLLTRQPTLPAPAEAARKAVLDAVKF
jgi:hypothetical protein